MLAPFVLANWESMQTPQRTEAKSLHDGQYESETRTQGFLAPGTDVMPIVPALEKIWADSLGQSLAAFNFRSVTTRFNDLVYQYPIRIPERYALVIRRVRTLLAAALS